MESGGGPPLPPGGRGGRGEALRALLAQKQVKSSSIPISLCSIMKSRLEKTEKNHDSQNDQQSDGQTNVFSERLEDKIPNVGKIAKIYIT